MKGMIISFLADVMSAAILWLWLGEWEEEGYLFTFFS